MVSQQSTNEIDEQKPALAERGFFERCGDSINVTMQNCFYNLGVRIGTSPWWFVAGALIISLVCISGMANFTSESDPNKLWVPDDTEAQTHYSWVKGRFGAEVQIAIYVIKCTNGNCLTPDNLDTALELYNNVSALNITHNDEYLSYSTLCYHRGELCWRANILEVFGYDASNWATQQQIYDTVNAASLLDSSNYTMEIGDLAGGLTTDTNGNVSGAEAIKMVWFMENNPYEVMEGENQGEIMDERAETWQKHFLDVPGGPYANFDVYKLASRSFGDEFGAAIAGDLIMVNISMVMLIVYCTITIGQCRPNKTRVALSFLGVMSVGLAITGSMGVCSALGLFYSPLASVLPFLLLGLGVDDMFVIVLSYDLTDPNMGIPERLGMSLAHSGASIAVTSLTDFLAFCIGGTTILPALRMFCFYAAVGILLTLFLQVFLFSAMLVIDERFKKAKYNDCGCCCSGCGCESCTKCCPCSGVPEGDIPRTKCSPCCGSADGEDSPRGTTTVHATGHDDAKAADVGAISEGKGGEHVSMDMPAARNCCGLPVNMLRGFMQNHLGPFLVSPLGGVSVIVVFLAIFGVAIWGVTQIKEDSDFRDFMPAGSYVIDYLNEEEAYFTTVGVPVAVYTAEVSYPTLHAEMDALFTGVKGSNTVVASTFSSWENGFYTYQTSYLGGDTTDTDQWYSRLNVYLAGAGARYRGDVKFANNSAAGSASNVITGARFMGNHRMCEDSTCQVKNMRDLRSTVSAVSPALGGSPAPFPFSEQYLNYEQYASIEEEAIRNIGLAFLAIFIITVAMIPNIKVALLVFLSVVLTILEVVGFMWHWDMKIDGVTVVMLIVALGLAIDYSAHIGMAYCTGGAGSRSEAVIKALADMGTPVCHGAMSTFIAIVVLAPSKSFVFISFFRQLFLTTVLGMGHGILLLPVLLNLLAPAPGKAVEFQRPETIVEMVAPVQPVASQEVLVKEGPAEPGAAPQGGAAQY